MKKLLVSLVLLVVPAVCLAERVTQKGGVTKTGKFISPITKERIALTKREKTLEGKLAAFYQIRRTHLPALNSHIVQLQNSFAIALDPSKGNLQQALAEAKNSVTGIQKLKAMIAKPIDIQTIDDIVAETHNILALAAEKQTNAQNAQLLKNAADSIQNIDANVTPKSVTKKKAASAVHARKTKTPKIQ